MPLAQVNTTGEWRPATGNDASPKGRGTLLLARHLPSAVAIAVNKVDRRTGDRVIQEGQVRVDFGVTSPYTINGSSVQIVINPSLGGVAPESLEGRKRRCDIRDLVESQIQELIRERTGVQFPDYDIEVIPMEMSGHSSGPNGVERTWGDLGPLPAFEWLELLHPDKEIIDFDGWHDKPFGESISQEEFEERFVVCTVRSIR